MSEEFIRGVDEDLRDQELKNMWTKYGKYIIGAAVGIVLAVGGKGIYTSIHESNLNEQAEKFSVVLKKEESSKSLEAIDVLQTLSTSGVEGYEVHAAFRTAKIQMTSGDTAAAVATLDAFAKNTSVDVIYRDLAKLQAALIGFGDISIEESIIRLEEITAAGGYYQYMAEEMLGMAHLSKNDKAKAYDIFLKLSLNMDAPEQVKFRAEKMAATVK